MNKPAGVQIKRWFLILVVLLLAVNVIALVSLYVVYYRIDEIKSYYQPIVRSSSYINEKILSAQIDLYKYLAEYQKDLGTVYVKTDDLSKELKKINEMVIEKNIVSLDVNLLNEIIESKEHFESAIKQLEKIEGKEVVDWEKVNVLKNYAIDMGTETFNKAARVNNDVNLLISKHNIRVTLISLVVVCVLFIFLIISVVIMIQLHYWWRKFEDIILEL